MHLLKRMGALALAAALCLNLAACGAASSSAALSAAASSQAVASSAAVSEAAGITLTDQAGRTVTLEQPAESIVSCYYISTYATIALGLKDKIVGLENKADTRALYALAAPELPQLTQVGTLKELNVVKNVLKSYLQQVYHARIEYPKKMQSASRKTGF